MSGWEFLGLAGLVSGGVSAAVGLLFVYAELARCWRRRRAERAAARRLLRAALEIDRAVRQERAAVSALSRPHGRRVVADLAVERARRRERCGVAGGPSGAV